MCTHKLYMKSKHHGSIFTILGMCAALGGGHFSPRGGKQWTQQDKQLPLSYAKVTRGTGNATELNIWRWLQRCICTYNVQSMYSRIMAEVPKERAADWLRKADGRRFTCRPGRGFASQTTECARQQPWLWLSSVHFHHVFAACSTLDQTQTRVETRWKQPHRVPTQTHHTHPRTCSSAKRKFTF